jgi:hypothetical protein
MGNGRPPTPTESIRLFRANLKSLWSRSPWWPSATIWLAPPLEAAFAEDCRRAGVSLSRIPPCIADTLRWVWRRSRLNHDDPQGWQRALAAARKRQVKIGEPPEGYVFEPPSATPPTNPRIKTVQRRAAAFEPAGANVVTDRTTRTRARRQKLAASRTPAGFDWQQFFQLHWLDLFRSIWRTYRLSDDDVDGEIARVLAIALKDKLDEQDKTGGTVGPASKRWDQRLRQLGQGIFPGQTPTASRLPHRLPPIASSSPSRRVVAPDNDAVMRELLDRVLNAPDKNPVTKGPR